MTETITVSLNKLIPWDGRVRRIGVNEAIEELAASIAAYRLLLAPVVRQRVLADINEWHRNPSFIWRALTEGEVPASDKRVRFVGLEAYEAAGGAVRRDLFDDDDGGTVIDQVLLNRLVSEKLTAMADEVRAEGWAWVEVIAHFVPAPRMDLNRHMLKYRSWRRVSNARP